MSAARFARLAFVVALGGLVVALWLLARSDARVDAAVLATLLLFVMSTAVTGVVVASRLPRHPIGWLLLASGLACTVGAVALGSVEVALSSTPDGSSVNRLVARTVTPAFELGVGICATYVPMLFPSGALPSARWRPLPWIAGVALVANLTGLVLDSATIEAELRRPVTAEAPMPVLVLEHGGFLLLNAAFALSVLSLVARYRRSSGLVRQQLKWVALSALVMLSALAGLVGWEAFNGATSIPDDVENPIIAGALSLIPVAIGVAVLRYRLFDIDRLISRTISYAVLSAVLVGAYAVTVVALRAVLPVAGALPVAASTLVVAAVFNPLRRRLQAAVDRRFNRARYDIARTIDAFSGRLRGQTDVATLVSDVAAVAGQAVQPSHVSVWLRAHTAER